MSSWAGEERRSRPRSGDKYDLDMTWQDAWYSMRREIRSHIDQADEQKERHEAQFAALDAKMDDILILKTQVAMVIRVFSWLGAGVLSVLAFVFNFWDQIVSFFHKVFPK